MIFSHRERRDRKGGGPRSPARASASRTASGWGIPIAASDGSNLLLLLGAGCSGV